MPQPRELTDRYRLEKILRSGREATVLRAVDTTSGQPVIVKLVTAGDAVGQADIFARFARTLASIRHPALPRVLDAGLTTDRSSFLVFELLSGEGLDGLVGEPPDRLLPLLAQTASGLSALADRGLHHHNLSPDNLFLTHGTGGEKVRILGLGRGAFGPLTPPDGDGVRYRAPELEHAGTTADWKADVFSLAVVACDLLGATIAMGEGGDVAVQMPLALAFELANDEALRQTLERCLRPQPADRPGYPEMQEAFRLAGGTTEVEAAMTTTVGEDTRPPLNAPAGAIAEPPLLHAPAPAPPPTAVEAMLAQALPKDLTRRPPERLSPRPLAMPVREAEAARTRPPAIESPPTLRPDESGVHQLSALQAPELPLLDPTLLRPPPHELSPASGDGGRASGLPPDFDGAGLEGFHLDGLRPFDDDAAETAPSSSLHGITPAADLVEEPAHDSARGAGQAGDISTEEHASAPPEDEAPLLAAQFLAALTAEPESRKSTPPPPRAPSTGPPALSLRPDPPPLRPPGTFPPRGPATSTWAQAEPARPTTPPVLPPAPAEEQPASDLLSIDEDLLKALAAPAPPPAAAVPTKSKGRPAASAARPAGAPPQTSARGGPARAAGSGAFMAAISRLPKPALWGAIGGLVALAALATYLLVGRQAPPPPVVNAPPAATLPAAPPPPRDEARAKLAAALAFLDDGRAGDAHVRSSLDALSSDEIAALPPAECAQVDALRYAVALAQRETLVVDLPDALRAGDLGQIENLVDIASARDLPPTLRTEFARAQNLTALYRQAENAAATGHPLEVLQRFATLQHTQRGLRDERQLQAHAAATIEQEADALGHAGRYSDALNRLEGLAAAWPERSGIRDLLQSYRQYAADETRQQQILTVLPTYERRRKPSEGLDLLRDVKPTPHLAAPLAEARKRLEDQLAQLDAQPPQVVLRDGYQLQYSRGMVVELSFRVTDDYAVKSVKLMARAEGGRMQELPLQKEGFSYTVQIPPTVHKNGTIEFYVVATDLSGHEGALGSKEHPLQLTRLQGRERLLH